MQLQHINPPDRTRTQAFHTVWSVYGAASHICRASTEHWRKTPQNTHLKVTVLILYDGALSNRQVSIVAVVVESGPLAVYYDHLVRLDGEWSFLRHRPAAANAQHRHYSTDKIH